MLMSREGIPAALAAGLILIPVAVGNAGDSPPFVSATDAYRAGIAELKSGDTEEGLPALEYAAERGVLGAQLKLARIYASGNGVTKDSGKAFFFYRQIANQRADISPLSPVSKYVAEAFVATAQGAILLAKTFNDPRMFDRIVDAAYGLLEPNTPSRGSMQTAEA